jgi:hypothetical protein
MRSALPIRMSLGDPCALVAYHTMVGTERDDAGKNNLSFRIGSALEPMIVQLLADNGLDVWFALEEQLEIAHDDPWRVGHPDGLVTISDSREIGLWLVQRLPPDATLRLLRGEPAILEVKTLNAANFRRFMAAGYDRSHSLFATYYGQIQEYINTMASPAADELWESDRYREFVKTWGRPSWALVVALNKESQEIGMKVVERDREYFEAMNRRLYEKVVVPMYEGRIPEPDRGGNSEECWFCPYRRLCPLVQGVDEELRGLDDIPVEVGAGTALLPRAQSRAVEAGLAYWQVYEQIKQLEAEKERLRAELLEVLQDGEEVSLGNGIRMKRTKVRGRRVIDTAVLEGIAARFGFEVPYKQTAEYSQITMSMEKGE